MRIKDNDRKWMWCLLGLLVASNVYFVQEMIVALALFALGFLAIAFVILSMYLLQKGWEVAVERTAESRHLARQSLQPEQSARWTP